MRLLPLSALQVSFPFSGKQHEVHSLCSLADAGLVGMTLAGNCGQSWLFLPPSRTYIADTALWEIELAGCALQS